MYALHSTAVSVAFALLTAGCNEIVGFDDELPEERRDDLARCYVDLGPFDGEGPPTWPLDLELRFVDGQGGDLAGELNVAVCPGRPPGEPLDCSAPLDNDVTVGGAATLTLPPPPPPPPMVPGGPPGPPPGGPGPYLLAQSETYFPTMFLRLPRPAASSPFPPLPIFSDSAVRQALEPAPLVPFVDERAHLVVVIRDCEGAPAADVEVSLPAYAIDGSTLPFVRDETGRPLYGRRTSGADGVVGFLNIPTVGGRADAPLALYDAQNDSYLFGGASRPVLLQSGRLTVVAIAR